ncbi:MAG: nucleotidyltransferase domain-containing protein [Alphaproteobacteria bacterium]
MTSINRTKQILSLAERDKPADVASRILSELWPDQDCAAIAAGSWRRGEETETSDIDMIVLVPEGTPAAMRKSLYRGGWPVEMFVHDRASLEKYMSSDRERGMPSLMTMIVQGEPVPDSDHPLITHAVNRANHWLDKQPPALTDTQIEDRRYALTDLCDDLAAPKSQDESLAIALRLAPLAGDFYLRANGHWSGEGKSLLRSLRAANPEQADLWVQATRAAFLEDSTALQELAHDWMAPFGGPVFDGYQRGGKSD